ncbi:hypothetical protein Dimus_020684 [Dionaea muscipula]
MQTADVDDQVLGSSAMHSNVGELRTDGHERDGGKKRKRMSEADRVLGSSALHIDACELRTDGHERVTTQVAQHFCSSVSFHLKQINPLIDIDPTVLMRLVTTAPSPGDALSAPNH